MKPPSIHVRFILRNGTDVVLRRDLQELPDGSIGIPDSIDIAFGSRTDAPLRSFVRQQYDPYKDELRYVEL